MLRLVCLEKTSLAQERQITRLNIRQAMPLALPSIVSDLRTTTMAIDALFHLNPTHMIHAYANFPLYEGPEC